MRQTAQPFRVSDAENQVIFSADLRRHIESWILAGDIGQHSDRTLQTRRERMAKLVWFLETKKIESCGLHELRQFFQYLTHGHKEPGGRWGNARCIKPVTSGNVKSYHSTYRTFFNWLVDEGVIADTPMRRIPPPVDRPDQIQPLTSENLKALLAAARKSNVNPKRELAVMLLLLDTGIRATELCSLTRADVDLHAGQVAIRHGKGDKARFLPFSRDTKRALYNYLNDLGGGGSSGSASGGNDDALDTPLFLAERGGNSGGGLTRFGLSQLIARMGAAAGIEGVRCSPHTFRHTFAISFLRAGGNVFTLQQMLGHTALSMTNRYVAIAQADIEQQHRRYSPVANLKLSGKRG